MRITRIDVLIGLILLSRSLMAAEPAVTFYPTGEEFVGPFPSWKDIKKDYGAKGDGKADDTDAIQRALDEMKSVLTNPSCVLYFPRGTYRLTRTLTTRREAHNDFLGANLIGEDPAKTILLWDGPPKKPMFRFDSWYSKISRLTFDGNKIAEQGLLRAGQFATYCEISDLHFRDIPGLAINLGNAEGKGIAEQSILRCRFQRCNRAIETVDWNTLDVYVWYCLFEDCGKGINNVMGGYQAYENVFLRSKEFDLGSSNGMTFSVVNNVSIGSKKFMLGGAETLYARGNRVYNPKEPPAMSMVAATVLLDNKFITSGKVTTGIVNHHGIGLIAAGNQSNFANWPIRPHANDHPNATSLRRDLPKAIDGNPGTEFVDIGCNDPNSAPHPVFPGLIQWNGPAGKARKIEKYLIAIGEDVQMAPRDWELSGTNSLGEAWTELDKQKNMSWSPRQKRTFTIEKPQKFNYYRWSVTANVAGKPGLKFTEIEFIDDAKKNLLKEKDAYVSCRNESWGQSLVLEPRTLDIKEAAVETPRLPATPPQKDRKVFEPKANTGDDGAELQRAIDAAVAEAAGSRPVVHIPKGQWIISRELVIPANVAVQIIGDGCGNGTRISRHTDDGAVLRLKGPSRVTLRDLDISAGAQQRLDGIVIEDADQPGGRLYAEQLRSGGAGGGNMVEHAIMVDRLSQSDFTMLCGGFGDCYEGLVVRGAADADLTSRSKNQISFLTGATSHGAKLIHAIDGGRVVAEAFWYEGDWDYPAPLFDFTGTRGEVALAAVWPHMLSSKQPMFGFKDFEGLCTVVSSGLDYRQPQTIRIAGNGSQSQMLFATNKISNSAKVWPTDELLHDDSRPDANLTYFGCLGATMLSGKESEAPPDPKSVLKALAPLRAVRIEPCKDRPDAVTDVKIFRVQVTGGSHHDGVRIEATSAAK